MSTAAYRDWVKKGRPWQLARPIFQYRNVLREAGWPYDEVGTIGDEAHLTSETPQDHTPFSAGGWPAEHPYPYILALDVAHKPTLGRDVWPLVRYWLAEARAGRTPWVKYITFQEKRFDVRNDWVPVRAEGHNEHAHLSIRTDHFVSSIGSWSVLPKGNPVTSTQTGKDVWAETLTSNSEEFSASAFDWLRHTVRTDRKVDKLITELAAVSAAVARLEARPVPEAGSPAPGGPAFDSGAFRAELAEVLQEAGWPPPMADFLMSAVRTAARRASGG